ncbi:MAG: T9SS type A sorting domain-containing protein [Flavobacteriales bacterium]
MKKSILGMVSLVALSAIAQNVEKGQLTKYSNRVIETKVADRIAAKSTAGAESRWLNYAEGIIEYEFGGNSGLAANEFVLGGGNFIDLDTNASIEYSNGLFPVFAHSTAAVINPADEYFDYLDGVNNPFTVDSVEVVYNYFRNSESSVVDTAVVKVLKSGPMITWGSSPQFNAQRIDYVPNSDLSKFGEITGAGTVVETFKIPLTEADTTTNFYQVFSLGLTTEINAAAGDRVGAVVTFIPGQVHNLGDTIENLFAVTSFQENNNLPSQSEFTYNKEQSHSYDLSTRTRYQQFTGSIENGSLLPLSFLWYANYSSNHNYIRFKVSSPNVGTQDYNAINVSVSPNPTNGLLNITSQSNETTVTVFDMLGQEVLSTVNGGNFSVDLTNEKTGIYFVKISNELGTATSKIVRN